MDNTPSSPPPILPQPQAAPSGPPPPAYPQQSPNGQPVPGYYNPANTPQGPLRTNNGVPSSAPMQPVQAGPPVAVQAQTPAAGPPDPQQFFRSSYPVQPQTPVGPPPAASNFDDASFKQSKVPVSRSRKLMLAGAGLLLLLVLVLGGFFLSNYLKFNGYKQDGERKINEYMTLLKSAPDNKDRANEVIGTVLKANDISETSTDPNDIAKVSQLASDTGLVAKTIKDKAPNVYDEQAGNNKNGKYAVNKFYEIDVNGKKYYYRVTAERQDNGSFAIASTTLSEQKLTPQ